MKLRLFSLCTALCLALSLTGPALAADGDTQLGRPQKEAWYIGDSEVDFQTAQAAGMDCILVSWGFRDREELSAFGCPVADTIEELELQIAKKGS